MLTVNAFLHINSDKKEEYLEKVNYLVLESQKEHGCLFYNHYENVEKLDEFIIVEHWEDEIAIENHKESVHFKDFIEKINQYLVEDLNIIISS